METTWIQHPDVERLDDLKLGGMKIIQRVDQFRFSVDAVLLSHFVSVSPRRRYVDLGTGTGVIPLILSGRGAQSIHAFELNPIMAELATRNVSMNGKEEQITVIEGDYRSEQMKPWWGMFDDVVVNPPYRESGRGAIPTHADVALALHEGTTSLADVVYAARRLLRHGGRCWMIHLSERLTDCLCLCREAQLEPKRIRVVYSRPGGRSKLVLIEAKVGAKAGCLMDPPLFIEDDMGRVSEEVQSWYE